MANETIGHIDCPFGEGCVGQVRRYKTASAKLYWACRHGKITPNLGPGQDWIAERMRPVTQTDDESQPSRGQEYTPAPQESEKPKPKPRRKSLLAALWDDEDDDE